MCGIVGVVSKAPVNQLIYDALLLLQHRGQDAAGIVTQQGRKFFMHKAKGMVRDVFRTRNMRALPGNCRPGPGALPDGRQRLQRRRGAAVLRQRAVRPGAGAQRQPDQRGRTQGRAVQHRPPPHQHRQRLRGAAQRAGARAGKNHARPAADAGRCVCRRARRAQARQGLVCRGGADRRPRPAGVSRPVRHPPAVHRPWPERRRRHRDGGQRIGGAGRHRLPVRARHRAGRSGVRGPGRQGACRAMRRPMPGSIPAFSSLSTWRGPIR